MSGPLLTASAEALFRYHIVSLVLAARVRGSSLPEAIGQAARHAHPQLTGKPRRASERTIRRWVRAFEQDGLAGLEPAPRPRSTGSAALPSKLLEFVRAEKQDDPRASLPELIERAQERGVLRPGEKVCRSTLWRACLRMEIPVLRRKRGRDRDTRRFAYPHRMQVVLCDGKHFRAGSARRKRLVFFFLDDATRRVLHAVVGTSETTELFLRGLHETVRQHGLMDTLYEDHGPGFISHDTAAAVARLGALLIHGEKQYPEGHGKIERFNRFVLARVLRHFDGRADVDPDCGALELRLLHYLHERYGHRPHEGLDGDSPVQRWDADTRALRFPESDEALRGCFVVRERRRVSNDHVISFAGTDYEVPRGHAGKQLSLERHLLDETLWIEHQGELVQLHLVDLTANARDRRARGTDAKDEPRTPLPPSAAELHRQRDYPSLVGDDGGFSDTETPDDQEIP